MRGKIVRTDYVAQYYEINQKSKKFRFKIVRATYMAQYYNVKQK